MLNDKDDFELGNSNKFREQNSNKQFFDLITELGCSTFKSERKYPNVSKSEKEKNFPIAYGILVHRNVFQLELLLKSIYEVQNVYIIHVDRKSARDVHNAAYKLASCFDNVHFLNKTEVVYASFNRLQADLNCMDYALQQNVSWKYFMNLAAEMMPVKSNKEIVAYLERLNGKNLIEILNSSSLVKVRTERKYTIKRFKDNYRIERTTIHKNKVPLNITLFKGLALGIFSHSFLNFVMKNKNVSIFLNWLKDTYSPDETFWSTLNAGVINGHIFNAPSIEKKRKLYAASHVYIKWMSSSSKICYGNRIIRKICILGLRDLKEPVQSKKILFVNKVRLDIDPIPVFCLANHSLDS